MENTRGRLAFRWDYINALIPPHTAEYVLFDTHSATGDTTRR